MADVRGWKGVVWSIKHLRQKLGLINTCPTVRDWQAVGHFERQALVWKSSRGWLYFDWIGQTAQSIDLYDNIIACFELTYARWCTGKQDIAWLKSHDR